MLKRGLVAGVVLSTTIACGNADQLSGYGRAASRLYDATALARYRPDQRAYVMGHALGVYLYSRTLPGWIAGSGFDCQPRVSAPHARVDYDYAAVVTGEIDETLESQPGDECYQSREQMVCPDTPSNASDDCETFLDPAAMQARAISTRV